MKKELLEELKQSLREAIALGASQVSQV